MAQERQAPDAVLDSTNYSTLVVTDIDEDPDSPDANWGTWDGNGDTICRTSFPTPSEAPSTGAGLQEFRVQIRKSSSGGNSTTWAIQLFESGTQVGSDLATGTTTSTTGEVVAGTWDASSLGTADGSVVEAVLIQTGGGGGNPSNRRGIEVGAIEWNAEIGGGAVTLDGQADAVSGSTSDADVAREAAGTIPTLSGSTADTEVARDAAGTIPAVSASSAAAEATRPVDGSAAALSDSAAAVDAARSVDGSTAAVTGATAATNVARGADGSAAAISGSAAAADATRPVDGTLAAISGSAAAADATRPVDGTLAAISGSVAELDKTKAFAGTLAAISSAPAAAANVARGADGSAAVLSGSTAAAEATRPVDGSAATISGSAAAADAARPVNGTLAAISSAPAAAANVARGADGSAATISGSAAAADAARPVDGTLAAISGSAAAADAARPIDGALAALSSVPAAAANVVRDTDGTAIVLSGAASDLTVEGGGAVEFAGTAVTVSSVPAATMGVTRWLATDPMSPVSGGFANLSVLVSPAGIILGYQYDARRAVQRRFGGIQQIRGVGNRRSVNPSDGVKRGRSPIALPSRAARGVVAENRVNKPIGSIVGRAHARRGSPSDTPAGGIATRTGKAGRVRRRPNDHF